MYNEVELYELSFVSPRRRPRTKPKIVFTIRAEHFEEIRERLHILADRWQLHAEAYCSPGIEFVSPTADLFGHRGFGYGTCGLVKSVGDTVRFEIELSHEKLYCCSLTAKLLTMALAVPIPTNTSNRLQQVDLSMRCDRFEAVGYGHATGGYASSRLIRWLKRQANGETIPVPPAVVSAMHFAWTAIVQSPQRRWTRECRGVIWKDGGFGLDCFGNACDLSIYPSSLRRVGATEPYAEIGCHNLDTAQQQLTLIAGLAKLCELARADE